MITKDKIAVLYADNSHNGLTHSYFAAVLESFKTTCEALGYNISFLNCNRNAKNRRTYMEQMKYYGYDALFVLCIEYDDPEVIELLDSDIPVVAIDEILFRGVSVVSDNSDGIKQLVYYLNDLGHKKIAYICGDDNPVTDLRLKGFYKACQERKIEIKDEYIKPSEYRNILKAEQFTEELLELEDRPSCIIYPDDLSAVGGINKIHAKGYNIPDDISVVGYDGLDVLTQFQPRLTTIKQNTEDLGRTAAENLIEILESGDYTKSECIIVDTLLEKGKTVGKINS